MLKLEKFLVLVFLECVTLELCVFIGFGTILLCTIHKTSNYQCCLVRRAANMNDISICTACEGLCYYFSKHFFAWQTKKQGKQRSHIQGPGCHRDLQMHLFDIFWQETTENTLITAFQLKHPQHQPSITVGRFSWPNISNLTTWNFIATSQHLPII